MDEKKFMLWMEFPSDYYNLRIESMWMANVDEMLH
jgi:hypothetical protein